MGVRNRATPKTVTPRTRRASAAAAPPSACQVLIVGAGPAGVSTWLHLHRLAPEIAERTYVIDRATFPRDKPCGGAITPLGSAILEGLDALVTVPTVVAPWIEFRLGSRSLTFRHPAALRVVRRIEFDDALVRLAVGRGMVLRQDETFQAIDWASGAPSVRTDRGTFAPRVVVAADGAQSAVRRAVFPDSRARFARLLEVVTPIEAGEDDLRRNGAIFDFGPREDLRGYVWHFPCLVAGRPAATRGVFDARPRPTARADLRAVLNAALFERSIATTGRPVAHPIRVFDPAAPPSAANVILVGDAAGSDAALGEGIAHALDAGDLAADAIIDAFDAGDFSFADYPARLRAHPVGRTLIGRRAVAAQLYAGSRPVAEVLDVLAGSLLPA